MSPLDNQGGEVHKTAIHTVKTAGGLCKALLAVEKALKR